MPAIKSDAKQSERLLNIDWGQPPSGRQQPVAAAQAPARLSTQVRVRIDDVFAQINAYRAIVDSGINTESLLAQSLISQANAIFNQAFMNLQAIYGFESVFADTPVEHANIDDVTDLVIAEVLKLQSILNPQA
ncbi:MAG: hypothetical protein HPKKFMNG_01828 [Planctomycetes bacterium]|nr:hypothetical protein [Planctomycetota bacterium]HRJ78125.1 hypothetical protein [Planctomycetota bacterium]